MRLCVGGPMNKTPIAKIVVFAFTFRLLRVHEFDTKPPQDNATNVACSAKETCPGTPQGAGDQSWPNVHVKTAAACLAAGIHFEVTNPSAEYSSPSRLVPTIQVPFWLVLCDCYFFLLGPLDDVLGS